MTDLDPAAADVEDLKEFVAAELQRVRDRSLGLTTAVLAEDELTAQHSPLMSPLVWDLAHVGNYEELWLLREAAGIEPMRPEIDDLYDAFEHPRSARPTLPLLSSAESSDYIGQVRRKVLDSLEKVRIDEKKPLLQAGFVYGMVLQHQHEHQHDETMLATHQLRRGAPALPAGDGLPAPSAGPVAAEVHVPKGEFVMGTSTDPWAYDNERPGRSVHLPPYWIDTTPVSVGAYRHFVEDGGYDDARWWSDDGWQWRCRSGKTRPAFWLRDGNSWVRRRFGLVEPLPDNEPVQHVCWYEADAYARWAGRRLPREAEWEKAASWDPATGNKRRFPWGETPPDADRANLGQTRYRPTPVGSFPEGASAVGALQMLGDVWECTASDFTGHQGFCTFPYAEYSEVFFGSEHKVLRRGVLGHRSTGLPQHVPQLGLSGETSGLRRLPNRPGRLMCRHLAWVGASVTVSSLLLEPEFSLLRQSYAPRHQQHRVVNADGFGVGWYVPQRREPVRCRQAQPIWGDASGVVGADDHLRLRAGGGP